VEKVSPELVIHDKVGHAYTVRYEAVNAMLLNEFRKQHDHVIAQDGVIARRQAEIAALKARLNQVDALMARLDALECAAAKKLRPRR